MEATPQDNNYMARCGLFWITNSIMAAVIGMSVRDLQEQAHERNNAFQEELQRAKDLTQIKLEAEKIAFKRRLMRVTREYNFIQNAELFQQQLDGIELQAFLSNNKYWPLDKSIPYTIISDIKKARKNHQELPLNVIILHSPLLPTRLGPGGEIANREDRIIYAEIEEQIECADIPSLFENQGEVDIFLRRDACKTTDFIGGNANIMNIHFLMSPIPTLVISPRYYDGKLYFNSAVWDHQSPRPLIRPLFSIDYELYIERNEEEKKALKDMLRSVFTCIIAASRDSYMLLSRGKEPAIKHLIDNNSKIKNALLQNEILNQFVKHEYQDMLEVLDVHKTPRLLEVFEESDVKHMREEIFDTQILS